MASLQTKSPKDSTRNRSEFTFFFPVHPRASQRRANTDLKQPSAVIEQEQDWRQTHWSAMDEAGVPRTYHLSLSLSNMRIAGPHRRSSSFAHALCFLWTHHQPRRSVTTSRCRATAARAHKCMRRDEEGIVDCEYFVKVVGMGRVRAWLVGQMMICLKSPLSILGHDYWNEWGTNELINELDFV